MNHPLPPKAAQGARLLLEALADHARDCSLPQCDYGCRLAAFVAHSLGVRSAFAVNRMEDALAHLNRTCPSCGTERN